MLSLVIHASTPNSGSPCPSTPRPARAVSTPEDVATAMRRIEDEATRMGALVEDLLMLARLDDPGVHASTLRRRLRDLERAPAQAHHASDELVEDRRVHVEDDVGLGVGRDEVVHRHEVHGMLLRAVPLGPGLGHLDGVQLLARLVGVRVDEQARNRGDHDANASPWRCVVDRGATTVSPRSSS